MASGASVDLLTAAPWLFSVGDIATHKATANALAERGIASVSVDLPRPDRMTVIGGGHVLGHQPHLRHFVLNGRHVLNAVGVHATGDYSYLREYKYVSVRDELSAKTIGVPCERVPCPAILLEPSQLIRDGFPPRHGGAVVVHRDPLCERAVAKRAVDFLVVDPQPARKFGWHSGGTDLPITHCPERMIAALRGAHCVITRSLHIGIFAMVAGVPFACIDTGDEPQSNKCRGYFRRAEIVDVMTNSDDPIRHAVGLPYDWLAVRDRERARCERHFDEMAAAIRA